MTSNKARQFDLFLAISSLLKYSGIQMCVLLCNSGTTFFLSLIFLQAFGRQHQYEAEQRESKQGHKRVHDILHILYKPYMT